MDYNLDPSRDIMRISAGDRSSIEVECKKAPPGLFERVFSKYISFTATRAGVAQDVYLNVSALKSKAIQLIDRSKLPEVQAADLASKLAAFDADPSPGNLGLVAEAIISARAALTSFYRASGLASASPAHREDPEFVLAAIKRFPADWKQVSKKLASDKEFVIRALKVNPHIFPHVDALLKEDKDVARPAIQGVNGNFAYIGDMLAADREFVIEQLKSQPQIFRYLLLSFKDDEEIATIAVRANGSNFKHLSERLRDNFSIACIASVNWDLAFTHMSERLRKNFTAVGLGYTPSSLLGIGSIYTARTFPILKNTDRLNLERNSLIAFLKTVIPDYSPDKYKDAVKAAFERYQTDKGALVAAIRAGHPIAVLFAGEELKKDVGIAREVYTKAPHLKQLFPEEVRFALDPMTLVTPSLSTVGDVQYRPLEIPQAVSRKIAELDLRAPEAGSWEHALNVDIRAFVTAMPESEAKTKHMEALNTLIERIRHNTPYAGTPPSTNPQAVLLFYDTVRRYLARIDVFLERNPDAKNERLQILEAATVCGGGLLAQLEQIDSLRCEVEGHTPETIIGKWLGAQVKRIIENLNIKQYKQGGNVHTSNILQWQLYAYIGGVKIPFDHLAHPVEETGLMSRFAKMHCAKEICDQLAKDLRENDAVREKLIEYVNEALFKGAATTPGIQLAHDAERARLGALAGMVDDKRASYETFAATLAALPEEKVRDIFNVFRQSYGPVRNSAGEIIDPHGVLKAQLKRIAKDPETGESLLSEGLMDFLISRKDEYRAVHDFCREVSEYTGIASQEVLSSSKETIRSRYGANEQARVESLLLKKFTDDHIDADGIIKPTGIALILEKMGFLGRIEA